MTHDWQCMNCKVFQNILETEDPTTIPCVICNAIGKLAPVVHVPKPANAK